jgi:hypothetical protein
MHINMGLPTFIPYASGEGRLAREAWLRLGPASPSLRLHI